MGFSERVYTILNYSLSLPLSLSLVSATESLWLGSKLTPSYGNGFFQESF